MKTTKKEYLETDRIIRMLHARPLVLPMIILISFSIDYYVPLIRKHPVRDLWRKSRENY